MVGGTQRESYTPGHTQNATEFMAQRSFETHGRVFAPYIQSGHVVLDAGCSQFCAAAGSATKYACEFEHVTRTRSPAGA